MMDFMDDVLRMAKDAQAQADVSPRRVMASHAVPYGRVYREWMANGDLVLWANRGEIADLPHRNYYGVDIAVSTMVPSGLYGIPVVNA